MAVPYKKSISVNFAQGLDTKTDPKQVQIGRFTELWNSIFNTGGLLQKRNGYGMLQSLADNTYTYLALYNDNLTAIGTNISAYNASNSNWVVKSPMEPMNLNVLPLLRNNLNQIACDAVIAPNGLVCTAYLETDGTTTTNKYVIADSVTGQNVVAPIAIPVSSGVVSGGMRVFFFANSFIIIFTNTISAVTHLQYIAISTNTPTVVTANANLASSYTGSTTLPWDAFVVGNRLFVAYNNLSGGQNIRVTYLNLSFIVATAIPIAGAIATMLSMTADLTLGSPLIYISYYNSGGTANCFVIDTNLNIVLAPTQISNGSEGNILNITSAAQNGINQVFMEVTKAYSWASDIPTNFVETITIQADGTLGSLDISARSIGLASKAFIVEGLIYYQGVYDSPYQPTYFLMNGTESIQSAPVIGARLAYSEAGGYLTMGLPSVTVLNSHIVYMAYRFKDLIQAVNKDTNVPTGTQVNGIYTQTGINLVIYDIATNNIDTSEIGNDLLISGGFLWMYDGYLPVEQNFFLYPDIDIAVPSDSATWSASGGSIAAQPSGSTNTNAYFYRYTYEWTDNAGNAFISAPSIPVAVTTTGSGTSGSITLNIPTLRLTYKIANPVKIVIYRWSLGQQIYYQTTSISSPLLNDTTVDSVTFVDTHSDATILGNNILYTKGGVLENTSPPATNLVTLFDTRFWMVDAENRNLIWYSKQVIQNVPVEMSQSLTIYVPPTTAAQGSTGPIGAISEMDDKLIIFKKNAIYYINGTGPDNTGANSQYSEPIFITSSVGCILQQSVAFQSQGLMFQSNKGIWILRRDLSTDFIGAPVEAFTQDGVVKSAQDIPGANQIRFVMSTGITLVYDYYYDQWSSFKGVPAISSCIYQGLDTFLNSMGRVYQETPELYLDGSAPVLLSFTTGPIRLGDLQNYQRAYEFFLLGKFYTPHKLVVSIAYDYNDNSSQQIILIPDNYSTPFGSGYSQSPFGEGNPFGGPNNVEKFRVMLERQRCMAFSITLAEVYDDTYGTAPGAGFSLSGINVICGFKNKFPTIKASQSFG